MITLDPPEASGDTIFCDDIRPEVSGKLILIGVYLGRMYVQGDFPFVLPKFSLAITYVQHREKFVTPIKFWVFLPGDDSDKPSIEAEMPQEVTNQALAQAENSIPSDTSFGPADYAVVRANMSFSNLAIPKAGAIRVRAVRGDTLIRLGSLSILRKPQPDAPKTAGSPD